MRARKHMRRLFALLLIATSAWMLYQIATDRLGGVHHVLNHGLGDAVKDPTIMVPGIGGAMCLLGGLTVFFGGPFGAMLSLLGGLGVAGFATTLKEQFELDHIWNNELAVGVTLLMLAFMTASIARRPPPKALDDSPIRRGRPIS